jgi:hypothetical protein
MECSPDDLNRIPQPNHLHPPLPRIPRRAQCTHQRISMYMRSGRVTIAELQLVDERMQTGPLLALHPRPFGVGTAESTSPHAKGGMLVPDASPLSVASLPRTIGSPVPWSCTIQSEGLSTVCVSEYIRSMKM